MKPLSLWQRLTTRHLLAILPIGLLFALALERIEDPDIWWHLKAGEWMLVQRAIPHTDLWSWMGATRPWIMHEWLFELGAAFLVRIAGLRGLIVATAGCVALGFGIVLWHARLRSGSPGLSGLLTLAAGITCWPFWSPRPQVLTYALTAYLLLSLDCWHRGERRHLWLLPPLVLGWVNLHGAYFLAFLLMGVYLLGEVLSQLWQWWRGRGAQWGRAQHLILVAGVSVIAALANPYGVEMLLYPFRYAGASPLTRWVEEWQSPDFRDIRLQPFGVFLIASMGALAASPVRPQAPRLILFLLLAAMALFSQRNAPLMVVATVPMAAEHLRALWDHIVDSRKEPSSPPIGKSRQLPVLNWAALGAMLFMIAARLPIESRRSDLARTDLFPVGAVNYLRRHPISGRMFNTYEWGGFLIWELAPGYQVFIDGRADVFGPEVVTDYAAVRYVEAGCWKVLDKYGIDWVVWRRDSPFAELLAASGKWKPIYGDRLSVIYVRRSARIRSFQGL